MWTGILIAVVVIAAGIWVWRAYFETYHFAIVKEGVLYRDGVRSQREFENVVRRLKPKTVVRLIDENERQNEPFAGEESYCRAHGIEVVELPIRLGGWPSGEQVKRFLEVTADPGKQPVIVHCAQGVRRTGMMVAAYQRAALEWDAAAARDAMLTFGHSQRTVGDVMKFIEVYDPGSGAVPDDLPMGKE